MSGDELPRRRAPWLVVVVLLPMLGVAWWIRGQVVEDYQELKAFCSATHRGEPWPHVQQRADGHGWAFVRQSPQGRTPEEWLCERDFWSYRAGCVVVLEDGRVTGTRFAELPKK